jgi:antitoxin CptB
MIEQNHQDSRLKRLHYRAWHRGTREADLMIGGFFDAHHTGWGEMEIALYEALMDEEDHDILAWVLGVVPPPKRYEGPLMTTMQQLDYVPKAN